MFCSQWAGRWAASSETTITSYVKELNDLAQKSLKSETSNQVAELLDNHLQKLIDDLQIDAGNYVMTAFPTVRRDRMSTYWNFLWLWHRLEATRWKMSEVQLRIGKRVSSCDVDHTVAFSLWEDLLSLGLPKEIHTNEDALLLVNRLGNCVLLDKNFNISKSKGTTKAFLQKVHEFESRELDLSEWCSALLVPEEMFDPTNKPVDEIKQAIDKRDKTMRDELADFAKGKKVRQDIDLPTPARAEKVLGTT
jgi:hypothetical protein